MKNTAAAIIIALAALLLAAQFFFVPQTAAADSAPQYALMNTDTPLYSAASDGYEVRVNLPATYFVTVLATSGYYYRVIYGDISGYVRQSAVEVVDYEPVTKHAYGTASLKSGIASVYLYEKADLAAAVATISGSTEIDVFGTLNAAEDVYYCRIKAVDTYYYGYLAAVGLNVTMPPENEIKAVETPVPVPDPDNPDDSSGPGALGDLPLQIILVLCLAVPAVVIVMLICSDKSKKKK